MLRALSGLFTTAAVGAMGFACGAFALSLNPAPEAEFIPPMRAPAVEAVVVAAREVPDVWPAVFGVVPEVAPEPVIAPEPEPVVQAEPEENNTYLLTGVIAGQGIESFAMLSENDRGVVVRKGDVLVGGETVIDIDQRGVWIEFDGVRELIPVPKTDFGDMVSLEQSETPRAATLADEVTLTVETLDRRAMEEMVTSAGRFELSSDGSEGLELLSIRDGQLFDQIGLRAGDMILAINGKAPASADLFANTPDTVLLRGAFEFDILRDGARQTVKVILEQG